MISEASRHLFFTGKGGVGKTTVACATAIALADQGKRLLLVSTDPASNLDEVLETRLGSRPTPVAPVPDLYAMNIDPEAAARCAGPATRAAIFVYVRLGLPHLLSRPRFFLQSQAELTGC